jgi:hypothetical protein
MSWTQVWDTPEIRLEKVHYLLPWAEVFVLPESHDVGGAVRAGRDGVLRAYCQRRGDLAGFGGERAGGADRDG